MILQIPIYITTRNNDAGELIYRIRPLFHTQPSAEGVVLQRVLSKLTQRLRRDLTEFTRRDRHHGLLMWHDPETYASKIVKMRLDLGDRSARLKLLLVAVTRHNRPLVFSPSLPECWFDLRKGEDLAEQAQSVFQSHFRATLKETPELEVERYSVAQSAWLDSISITIQPGRAQPKKKQSALLAALSGNAITDGAEELQKVGRCLSWLDIDDLTEPIEMETLVDTLHERLQVEERQPVVLVGPAGSGKSAVIEGAVRKRRQLHTGTQSLRKLVWQLSPARLISGMSYMGQWEGRVLAILKHSSRQDHVLYIDDFLGLFQAGQTRDSRMSVADLLRAHLDRLPVRIVTEMTAEAWAVLREKDRALADRFFVIRTEATDKHQSIRVLMGVQRQLESKHGCEFELDVLPETLGLYDRFVRDAVLPGKAAASLHRLAARHTKGQPITRAAAVAEFLARSGISQSIIDTRTSLTRSAITAAVRDHIIGQDDAVQALVDRILLCAARMNDTSRPIGTFLLLGPTGVGKTETAKWLAKYLFGEEGLIRLDMNELNSRTAVARLVGTFDHPDGLLTAAVRQKPHAVLLLDEIEKAHPAVLDLLLQVMGEARLSDARGRVADFSGTFILMTSNLGARESLQRTGFAGDTETRSNTHLRAARQFFRPEFFNRIDGLLDFSPLDRASIREILDKQLQEVLQRDGLARRRLVLNVEEESVDRVAAKGFDARLGARAVRRRLETDLVNPTARALTNLQFDQAVLVRVQETEDGIRTRLDPLEDMAKQLAPDARWTLTEVAYHAARQLADMEQRISHQPVQLEVGSQGIAPEALEVLTIREAYREAKAALTELQSWLDEVTLERRPALDKPTSNTRAKFLGNERPVMRQIQAADDIQAYLSDATELRPHQEGEAVGDAVRRTTAKLTAMLHHRGSAYQTCLVARTYGDHLMCLPKNSQSNAEQALLRAIFGKPDHGNTLSTFANFLYDAFATFLQTQEQLTPDSSADRDHHNHRWQMQFNSPLAITSLEHLLGGYLVILSDGRMTLAVTALDHIPDSPPPVRYVLHADGPLVDLRSGAAVNEPLSEQALVKLLAAALPRSLMPADRQPPPSGNLP